MRSNQFNTESCVCYSLYSIWKHLRHHFSPRGPPGPKPQGRCANLQYYHIWLYSHLAHAFWCIAMARYATIQPTMMGFAQNNYRERSRRLSLLQEVRIYPLLSDVIDHLCRASSVTSPIRDPHDLHFPEVHLRHEQGIKVVPGSRLTRASGPFRAVR